MAIKTWELEIFLDNGSTKIFTDFDSAKEAEERAMEIAVKGYSESDPNNYDAKFIYPPHRIQFIQTRESEPE